MRPRAAALPILIDGSAWVSSPGGSAICHAREHHHPHDARVDLPERGLDPMGAARP